MPDGLTATDLPVNPKYFGGFRSVETASGSGGRADCSALVQDLDETSELRGLRPGQGLIERLRDPGYL
ncbi:hypothetical protein [Halorientalis marina]|uniref:hypothetical protein n=1 Tax=Halorientalis marina TaxID=2931976 RepID=UPI001FF3129F|nr:hypothetical protein [Halorientalis marina]